MRWIGCCLVATVAVASAQPASLTGPRLAPPPTPPSRKPASPSWLPLHVQLFAKAIMADKAGDYHDAEREYLNVNRGNDNPHPEVYWNLADVYRRMERPKDAIEELEKYLEVATSDADKQAAIAWIAKLKETPYRLSISADEPGGAIFLDGVRFPSNAPAVIELPKGEYMLDWIGKEGFEHQSVRATPMQTYIARFDNRESSSSRKKVKGGNVVLSSEGLPGRGAWETNGMTFDMPARFTLPPGRHETRIENTCEKLVIDVPRDGSLVYVFVRATKDARRTDCTPITVTSQKVKP